MAGVHNHRVGLSSLLSSGKPVPCPVRPVLRCSRVPGMSGLAGVVVVVSGAELNVNRGGVNFVHRATQQDPPAPRNCTPPCVYPTQPR